MAESEQIAAVRSFVETFNRRDFDELAETVDDDTELHEWPAAPGAQTYRGRDGLRRALENWFESWEWMQIEIEHIEEARDRVLVTLYQQAQGKGSEVKVEIRSWNVWSFGEGKVTAIRLFTDRESALEVFGL